MRIVSVRHVDGPNIYHHKPVLTAQIELEQWTERESCDIPGFVERLLSALPGLGAHHCAKGEPGGFVERLTGGTYFGHIIEHVSIELASLAGMQVNFGKTLYAGAPGRYDIIVECETFAPQRELLYSAMRLVEDLLAGRQADFTACLRSAQSLLGKTRLGPSTRAIVDACAERGIPVRRLNDGSLLQLGYGRQRKLVEATVTQNTSVVAVDIACDKELTKRMLSSAAIPVPNGGTAANADEAVEWFLRIGGPVVVKPLNGNQGKGVSLNLTTQSEVRAAYEIAAQYSLRVIVEQHHSGRNIRVLVVDGKFTAASERLPAQVRGDGIHTITELIEVVNQDPRRGQGHEKPLTQIPVDDIVLRTLSAQGFCLESVPPDGCLVMVRQSANLSTGGEAIDITEELHASIRFLAERAARTIGLDVCGIDLVADSISQPADEARCIVIEVNAAPGIRMHQHPSYGTSRSVGETIVSSLYKEGENGRIPIVAVTGTNGKTTTTRLIGHAFTAIGKQVGMTTTGGVYVGGAKLVDGDTTGPVSAWTVLSDPTVDVAVLETARGGIVRGGLAYDKANVAVITNITLDHVGQDGIETVEDLTHVKSLVAECVLDDGTVVLNADDDELVKLSRRLSTRVVFFSASSDSPVMRRHLACGGVGYYVLNGAIVEGHGNLSWEIMPVAKIPLTMGGAAWFQVENCLAASAALRALGLTRRQIAESLGSFTPTLHNPGRCMIFQMPQGGHLVLDYGHNPDGFKKIGSWLRRLPHRQLIGVVGVPGDRADEVVRQSARELAPVFDRYIVKEDYDKRGRSAGEIAQLMAGEITRCRPEAVLTIILPELEALQYALSCLDAGDVAVMFYEKLGHAVSLARQLGGVQVANISNTQISSATAIPL